MPARILLVRHGRSAHDTRGWLTAAGVHDWLAAYDIAGLARAQRIPRSLRTAVAVADCIAASDLPRARASAALLAPEGDVVISPLLREATMMIPAWQRVRLPLPAWALVLGARWLYGVRRGDAPIVAAREQGVAAAAWLAELAAPERLVVAVTHHTIRGFIAGALAARGWTYDGARGPSAGVRSRDGRPHQTAALPDGRSRGGRPLRGRYAHWSAWTMRQDLTR